MDVAQRGGSWGAEAVDAEIDRLISRRASQDTLRLDPDEQEERWKASVRAYNTRNQEAMRLAWAAFHQDQAERHRRTLEGLIAHHEAEAERLAP